MANLRSNILVAAIGLCSFSAVVVSQLSQINSHQSSDSEAEINTIFEEVGIATTLDRIGFSGLSASILWIDFIQYFGGRESRVTNYSFSDDYLETIADVEPRFKSIYFVANSAVAFRSGQPEKASELLERGMVVITPDWEPQAYRLPMHHAIVNFLHLGRPDVVSQSYYRAADWYEQTQNSSGDGLRQLADRLYNNPDSRQAQFEVWEQTYRVTSDPAVKELALRKLEEVGGIIRHSDGSVQLVPPTE